MITHHAHLNLASVWPNEKSFYNILRHVVLYRWLDTCKQWHLRLHLSIPFPFPHTLLPFHPPAISSNCLSALLFVSVCLSVLLFLSVSLSSCLCVCLSIHLCISLFILPSVTYVLPCILRRWSLRSELHSLRHDRRCRPVAHQRRALDTDVLSINNTSSKNMSINNFQSTTFQSTFFNQQYLNQHVNQQHVITQPALKKWQ